MAHEVAPANHLGNGLDPVVRRIEVCVGLDDRMECVQSLLAISASDKDLYPTYVALLLNVDIELRANSILNLDDGVVGKRIYKGQVNHMIVIVVKERIDVFDCLLHLTALASQDIAVVILFDC